MLPFRADALFGDPRRHPAALAVLAAENLQAGDPAAAFRYADRRCRLLTPSAQDYLLRSEASRRAGFAQEAIRDLAHALDLDPTDRMVLRIALAWGSAAQKSAAGELLAAADSELSARRPRPGGGDRAVVPPPHTARAFCAWGDEQAPWSVVVPVYEDFEATRACFEALFAQGAETPAAIIAVDDAGPNPRLRGWLDELAAAGRIALIRNEANIGFAASVNRALALCPTGDVILVNADAVAPPTSLARLAEVARSAPDIGTVTPLSNNGEYTSLPRPNASNPPGPPEEVARIDALARKANGAAFVDLPNGVGFCLYITRACLDAVGPLPEIYARGYFEDVEFCLRAREKGFRTVCATGVYVGHEGGRSFGAEKRRLVMRNLAVLERRFPGYRLESASFLEGDPLRAARGAIEALSPPAAETVLLVCAEGAARLLAGARADELAATGGPAPLLCAWTPDGRVSLRAPAGGWPQSLAFRIHGRDGLASLLDYLRATAVVRIELFDPLSLPARLLTPLFRLGVRVDLAGGDLDWAVTLRAPAGGACPAPDDSAPCPACAAGAFSARAGAGGAHLARKRKLLSRARAIRPQDRMAEAFARQFFGDLFVIEAGAADVAPGPAAAAPLAPGGVLAVVMPAPDPLADRLVVALGRALSKAGENARVVVLGACVDDLAVMAPGNVFVTGAVGAEEHERLLRQYEVSALMAPCRTRFFGWTDRLSRAFGAPQAYFDYSMGKMPEAEGDLALDPRLCDARAAAMIAAWFLEPARGRDAPGASRS